MTQFLSLLLNGLSLGAIYALIALGFVIIFKASEVVSFTQGSLLLLGAYLIAPLARAARLLGGRRSSASPAHRARRAARRAAAHQPAARRPGDQPGDRDHRRRHHPRHRADPADRLRHPQRRPPVGRRRRSRIGEVGISHQPRSSPSSRPPCSSPSSSLAFKYSSWGVSMRAVGGGRRDRRADGHPAGPGVGARLDGRRRAGRGRRPLPRRCADPGRQPRRSYTVALRAFPAAILGGLDSTGGALVGGLLIGLAESLAAGYQDQLAVPGPRVRRRRPVRRHDRRAPRPARPASSGRRS